MIGKKSFDDAVAVIEARNESLSDYNFNVEAFCNFSMNYTRI